MAAQFDNIFNVELTQGPAIVSLNTMYYGNLAANRIGARVTQDGEAVNLGGSCAGTVIRADGQTVTITGTVSGNVCYIDLPANAYAVAGPVHIFVTHTASGVTTTLVAGFGTVQQTETASIAPGAVPSSVADLVAAIDAAVASIPSDYSTLWTSLAPAYSTDASQVYNVGDYVTYNAKVYRCRVKTAAGESFTSSHWTQVDLGSGIASVLSDLAAPYDYTAAYSVGDYCTYQARVYRCNTPIATGGEDWTLSHWTRATVGDVLKSLADQEAADNLAAVTRLSALETDTAALQTSVEIINRVLLLPDSWELKKSISTAGVVSTGNTFALSDYIWVQAGQTLSYTGDKTDGTGSATDDYVCYLAIYDAAKTFGSRVQILTAAGAVSGYTFENDGYVRIMFGRPSSTSVAITAADIPHCQISGVGDADRIADLEADVAEIDAGLSAVTGASAQIGNVVNVRFEHLRLQTDTATASAYYLCTAFIPVIGGSTVSVKTAKRTNTTGCGEYDENFRYIVGHNSTTENTAEEFTLSPYARYIRVCWYTSADTPPVDDWFHYVSVGVKSEYPVNVSAIARTGSTTNYFYGTLTAEFKANDALTFATAEDGYFTPSVIPADGVQTVTWYVSRTVTTTQAAQIYVLQNMRVTHNTVNAITLNESTGSDASNSTVKTWARALASGAKVITLGADYYGTISADRDITINGAGHVIHGDTPLTTEAYNSILKAAYTADDRITACYISQTQVIKDNPSGSSWKGPRCYIALFADDTRLEPYDTLEEVEATDNSFCWADGYFYIHYSAGATAYSYVTEGTNAFTGCNVRIFDATIRHYMSNVVSISGGHMEISGCSLNGSVQQNCVYAENADLLCEKCEVFGTWNDGINTHGRGSSTVIDCYCHHCGDDGISQHDSTTGTIIGGEFCFCGKGGISSPINSAEIDIYNVYCHDNTTPNIAYGIYASASSGSKKRFRVWDSVICNNRVGLKNAGHEAVLYGCQIYGNSTNISTDSGGTTQNLSPTAVIVSGSGGAFTCSLSSNEIGAMIASGQAVNIYYKLSSGRAFPLSVKSTLSGSDYTVEAAFIATNADASGSNFYVFTISGTSATRAVHAMNFDS